MKFNEYKDTAVFSLKKIIFENEPILTVIHDLEGDWQFLSDDNNLNTYESALVSLEEIVSLDNSTLEVADLDYGWMSYRRTKDSPWIRMKIEDIDT